MVPALKWFRRDKRSSPLAIILCLVLTAALSATSLLAAVNAVAACDRQCCCCTPSIHGSTVTIRNATEAGAGCCGPVESSPCNMSAGELPASPPALLQTTGQAGDPPAQPSLAADKFTVPFRSFLSPAPWAPNAHEHNLLPVYLQTCRLIC